MRRGLIIGVTLGLVAVGVLFRFSFMAFALYALCLAYVASVVLARYSLDGVECSRIIPKDRAEIGETIAVRSLVSNHKHIPVLWVLVEDVLPPRLEARGDFLKLVLLPSRSARALEYSVTFNCRGYHQIGPVVLESGDLFGFVRRIRTARMAHYVTVRPIPEPILRYDVETHRPIGEIRVRRQIYEDPTRLAGVRHYRVGDPLNRIHWKTTARTGELHCRVYEPTVLAGATVVLDFCRASYAEPDPFERSELGCVAAASVACYLTQVKETVGFCSNGLDAAERVKRDAGLEEAGSRHEARRKAFQRSGEDRLRPVRIQARRGDAQAAEILDALARLELSDGQPLERMLVDEAPGLPRDLALIVITPALAGSLAQTLVGLKFWGFDVTVMLLRNDGDWESIGPVLRAQNVQVMHVRDREDLHDIAVTGI